MHTPPKTTVVKSPSSPPHPHTQTMGHIVRQAAIGPGLGHMAQGRRGDETERRFLPTHLIPPVHEPYTTPTYPPHTQQQRRRRQRRRSTKTNAQTNREGRGRDETHRTHTMMTHSRRSSEEEAALPPPRRTHRHGRHPSYLMQRKQAKKNDTTRHDTLPEHTLAHTAQYARKNTHRSTENNKQM